MPYDFVLKGLTHRASIRRKLLLLVACSILSVMLFTAGIFLATDIFSSYRDEQQDLLTVAKIVGRNCSAAIDFNDRKVAAELLGALAEDPRIMSAWIVLPDGEVFARYVRPDGGASVAFALRAPNRVGTVAFRVRAASGDVSDGELRPVPVLPEACRSGNHQEAGRRAG